MAIVVLHLKFTSLACHYDQNSTNRTIIVSMLSIYARLFPFRSSFPDIQKASLVGGYGTIITHVFIICGSSISNNGERQQQQQQGQRQKQQRTTATSAGGEREKEEGG